MLFYMSSKPFDATKNHFAGMYYLFFNRYPQIVFLILLLFHFFVIPCRKTFCKTKLLKVCYLGGVATLCYTIYSAWDFIAGIIYSLDICERLCIYSLIIMLKFSGLSVIVKENNLTRFALIFFISARRRWNGVSR